ncbi:MAG: M67 family peptidase [Deltaproteobacteria bacterium]|nr:MAG: M67 family peptidase [Deltaproteobacteria bacterium]
MSDLPKEIFEEIFEHAETTYPNEACGLVLCDEVGRFSVRRCENMQDRLHALDPERYPRTARTAYHLDPREVLRAEAEKKRVVALYHSHCDAGAYFSEEDRAGALWDGEPVYPGVQYLVVSVMGGNIEDIAAFAWNPRTATFEKLPLSPAWKDRA